VQKYSPKINTKDPGIQVPDVFLATSLEINIGAYSIEGNDNRIYDGQTIDVL